MEHVATARGGAAAVKLDPAIKRHLGIGNSTGLGMAPFLIYHPELIHNWLQARETAIARVRATKALDDETVERLQALFERAKAHVAEWKVPDAIQTERLRVLCAELSDYALDLSGDYPLQRLLTDSKARSVEFQELMAALCLEPFGEVVDDLTQTMAFGSKPAYDPAMKLDQLSSLIAETYGWCEGFDMAQAPSQQRFWYVSEAKLEPRLGDRYAEDGADREQPLDIARQVQALCADLRAQDQSLTVSAFLAAFPEHRNIVRRIQSSATRPFAEIRDNLIDQHMRPIDLLRCKLAFFGAVKFDPKSDLWTRITLFQGAPLRDELVERGDDWWLSTCPQASAA